MKPIGIFRHARTEGPGHFGDYLDQHSVSWRLIKIDQGEAAPTEANEFAGLVFMGGPMSVNDELHWLPNTFALIRDAVDKNIPVLGHCLGGQLMSKALGGAVSANPIKEIGWGDVTIADNAIAREWLGDERSFNSFHWHGETFSLPPGATLVASSAYCENQMFALGPHFGMQCHVEMTPELIESWCASGAREIESSRASPAVMSASAIHSATTQHLPKLHTIADRIYARWLRGLRR